MLKKLRQYFQLRKIYARSNEIVIVRADGRRIVNPRHIDKALSLKVLGRGNRLEFHEPFAFRGLKISLSDNASIVIERGCQFSHGCRIKRNRGNTPCAVHLGAGFQCGRNCVIDITDNGNVTVGADAKWSWNIYLKSDDTHPVFDCATGRVLNKSAEIKIGDHVWIGMNAIVLKNSHVASHSIIGAGAVVAGKFPETNAAIAGNPARVVKTGIDWDHGSIALYCGTHPGS